MTKLGLAPKAWRALRANGGAAAVEFAISISIFAMIWMGVAEFGRAMWIRNTLQAATEEAARYAMAHNTASDSALITKATDYFEATGNTTATFTVDRDTVSDADFVTINGTYTFESLFTILELDGVEFTAKSRVPLMG